LIVELVVGAEDLWRKVIVASCLQPETRAERKTRQRANDLCVPVRITSLYRQLYDTKGPSANNTTIATARHWFAVKVGVNDLPPAPFHGEEPYAEMMATRDMAEGPVRSRRPAQCIRALPASVQQAPYKIEGMSGVKATIYTVVVTVSRAQECDTMP
jgi:hypothetical protein